MIKKLITTIASLISLSGMFAQTPADLDINNVKARINPAGDLFWDFNSPKFEVPKGSGANTIYTGNLWIGGMDSLGQLHMAGQTYRQTGTDFFQGPIMSPSNYSSAQDALWNKVWKVNKYGACPLYLLDTDIPENEDNWICGQLYGWFGEERIAQEMVLGIAGVRALRALGFPAEVYHFNEGHATTRQT